MGLNDGTGVDPNADPRLKAAAATAASMNAPAATAQPHPAAAAMAPPPAPPPATGQAAPPPAVSPVISTTGVTNGQTPYNPFSKGSAPGDAIGKIPVVGGTVQSGLNSVANVLTPDFLKPKLADTSPLTAAANTAYGTAAGLANERQNYQALNAPGAAGTQLQTGNYDPTRAAQLALAGNLQQTVAGTAGPSAADLQMKQAMDQSAAQQFGLASALQGRSAGGALRQASTGSANVLGQEAAAGGIQRAQEVQAAQSQLGNTLGTVAGQDINVANQNAQLDQGTQLANLKAKLDTMGLDEATKNAILQAQIASQGQGGQAAQGIVTANTSNAAAQGKADGGVLSTLGSVVGML